MKGKTRTVQIIRWIARILGLIYVAFWLMMFIGETLSQSGEPNTIEFHNLIGLIAVFAYMLCLIIAWKWEAIGGIAAIIFIIIFAVAVPDALLMCVFMALPAILFIICWLMSRSQTPVEANHS
jgi:hypothetical protein